MEKPDGQIGNLKYGDVINMFFNIKHGVKIIWPNRPLGIAFYQKYKIPPTSLPVMVGPRETPNGSSAIRGLHFAQLDFSEAAVEKMMENCYHASQALTKMAQARMEWLEAPDEPHTSEVRYESLHEIFRDALSSSRISNSEKMRLLEEWPQV